MALVFDVSLELCLKDAFGAVTGSTVAVYTGNYYSAHDRERMDTPG